MKRFPVFSAVDANGLDAVKQFCRLAPARPGSPADRDKHDFPESVNSHDEISCGMFLAFLLRFRSMPTLAPFLSQFLSLPRCPHPPTPHPSSFLSISHNDNPKSAEDGNLCNNGDWRCVVCTEARTLHNNSMRLVCDCIAFPARAATRTRIVLTFRIKYFQKHC